ncbi:family 78 glycoside hydrolase catalytic domain [Maribellus maritimus]|uniref:family 78 glycoside hydrolase catalytic domain n=1 Tax=Maribellus maritimus TaxID=2870838 RepID=UPI001EEB3EFB|nr:family 78 glycoside hydrolase catalytic domain [Maribellus maritimus]MCG6190034.1 glycoside hydrolase family 78 protein [Maribellus maritimus]
MITHFWKAIIATIILLTQLNAKAEIKVVDLQCEYLTNPIGIDVQVPRFSWKLLEADDVRGQYQTGYQIMVSSEPSLLTKDNPDLWNSGWIESDGSVLIPYAGEKLKSENICYWKVRVKDKKGIVSDWSKPAKFTLGLLSSSDWKGEWIKHPSAPVEKHIWFRKNFSLDEPVTSGFIYVASAGYHELYINGDKVDSQRLLAPTLTRLDKRILYVTYDISKFLKKGENTIAFWTGPGWARYSYFNTYPAILAQVSVDSGDGQKVILSTDTSWRCGISSSENTGGTEFADNGGEAIVAARHVQNWNKTDFDDSNWALADEANITAELSAQMIEPTSIIDTLHVKQITGSNPCRIDFGKNFTGWVNIRMFNLSAGDTVYIRTNDDSLSVQDSKQMSFYVSDGKPVGVFENRFNYMAGRFVTIEGLKKKPIASDITAYAIGTDIKRTGYFSCSDSLFNKIYETDLWTFRANTTEGYTSDCPHRERLGYGEENFSTIWGCGLPNYNAGALYTKVIRDWCDVQEENGWINHTAPQINEHFGGPMWSSAPLNLSWEFYQIYGDKKILDLSYTTSKKWLDFLSLYVKDGLLTPYSEHWGKFLGDWLAPNFRTERGNSKEAIYFNNCVYAYNLQTFVKIAEILGNDEDVKKYGDQLDLLKNNIQVSYFKPDSNIYMQGRQVQLAFPLLADITPENLKSDVLANFKEDIHNEHPYLDMGSSGVPVLLKFLVENADMDDVLYDHLSKTSQPSYGYFLANGETTWPEYWNGKVPSRIHTCYTGIASWFIKGLGGISSDPEKPGYKNFIIRPAFPGDLAYANTKIESLYGTIKNNWVHDGSRIVMNVGIPVNSRAKVYVPANEASDVTESGLKIQKNSGVEFMKMEGAYAVFLVPSGKYKFESHIN